MIEAGSQAPEFSLAQIDGKVETLEQLSYLRAHGCDEIQGYYLSKPITADEISRFLKRDLRHLVSAMAAA